MPLYQYKHPETGELQEKVQKINDEHTYERDGVKWIRVFTAPNIGVDTKVNPDDKVGFIEKTGKMKGTVGDMMDYSAELSEERASKTESGEDPVKRKVFDDYKKSTGKKHLKDQKKTFENSNVKIDID
jgi:hypothetical protein